MPVDCSDAPVGVNVPYRQLVAAARASGTANAPPNAWKPEINLRSPTIRRQVEHAKLSVAYTIVAGVLVVTVRHWRISRVASF